MVITAAFLLAIIPMQGQEPAQNPPSAGEIVSKMLKRYSGAECLTGSIKMRQAASGQVASGSIDTVVQYEKPSKIYVRQVQSTSQPRTWILVSDGTHFSYNVPSNLAGDPNKRLVEMVNPRPNETLDIRKIYEVATYSLGDKSAPLDVVIGRPADLQYFADQIVSTQYAGQVEVNGETVHVIRGGWRESRVLVDRRGQPITTGQYEMHINEAGDLRRYSIKQNIQPTPAAPVVEVVTQWDLSIKVGGKPDPSLFKLLR